MTKKSLLSIALIASAAMFTACQNGQKTSQDTKEEAKAENGQQGLKIAYIEIDSVNANYTLVTESAEILKKKMETIQSTLNSKGLALQNEMGNFQNKVQSGQVTQEQAAQMQASLQKKQQQLQNLQESLGNEYQKLQEKYNNALHDSINNFLKSYNKAHGYDYILSKSGDNILYANAQYDITEDVIKGLNKRYQGKKEK